MATSDFLIIFFKIAGSLALLIYGMKIMSEALASILGRLHLSLRRTIYHSSHRKPKNLASQTKEPA